MTEEDDIISIGEIVGVSESLLEVDAISDMLFTASNVEQFVEAPQKANKCDMSPEVVWSAMNYLKENPAATIQEACDFGIGEWQNLSWYKDRYDLRKEAFNETH